MSRSSSETEMAGPCHSGRVSGRMFDSNRIRSLSLQADPKLGPAYKDDLAPETSGAFEDRLKIQDIGYLENLHSQLLSDNLRLWECVNIIRCNPRLKASNVLRQVYSQVDQEFFKNYPTYANYSECGHGALNSSAEGGGAREAERYWQHLRVHNNGLMRENTRLMLALDILDHQPLRTADEALCHSFAMSDDQFVCRYPEAQRGSRLRASLAKLREDERKRHRSTSLPGYLYNPFYSRAFSPGAQAADSTTPSCSNNNETFPRRISPRSREFPSDQRGPVRPVAYQRPHWDPPSDRERHQHEPADQRRCKVYERSRSGQVARRSDEGWPRKVGDEEEEWLKVLSDRPSKRFKEVSGGVSSAAQDRLNRKPPWSPAGRRYSSPDKEREASAGVCRRLKTAASDTKSLGSKKSSPWARHLRSRSDRAKRNAKERPLDEDAMPYMMSQHPYNWTSHNRSGNHHSSGSHEEGGYYDAKGIFHPEEDEEGSVVYRKQVTSSTSGRSSGARGSNNGMSRISYSSLPAPDSRRFPLQSSAVDATRHNSCKPKESMTSVGSGISQPRGKNDSWSRDQDSRRSAGDVNTYLGARRGLSDSRSPLKHRTSIGSPRRSPSKGSRDYDLFDQIQSSDDKRKGGKNVTFEKFDQSDRGLRRKEKPFADSLSASMFQRMDSFEQNPHLVPMYYRSPLEKSDLWSGDDEPTFRDPASYFPTSDQNSGFYREIPSPREYRKLESHSAARPQMYSPNVYKPMPQESSYLHDPGRSRFQDDSAGFASGSWREQSVRGVTPPWSGRQYDNGVCASLSADSLDRSVGGVTEGRFNFEKLPSTFSVPSTHSSDPVPFFSAEGDTAMFRKPSVMSAPSSFSSVSMKARHQVRSSESPLAEPLSSHTLSSKKTHRVPTRHSPPPPLLKNHRIKEWVKNTSPTCVTRSRLTGTSVVMSRRIRSRKGSSAAGRNQNTNRRLHGSTQTRRDDPEPVTPMTPTGSRSASDSRPGNQQKKEQGQETHKAVRDRSSLPFLDRLLKVDNKMEELLKEKRELEQRYENDRLTLTGRKGSSVPSSFTSLTYTSYGDVDNGAAAAAVTSTRTAAPATSRWKENKNFSASVVGVHSDIHLEHLPSRGSNPLEDLTSRGSNPLEHITSRSSNPLEHITSRSSNPLDRITSRGSNPSEHIPSRGNDEKNAHRKYSLESASEKAARGGTFGENSNCLKGLAVQETGECDTCENSDEEQEDEADLDESARIARRRRRVRELLESLMVPQGHHQLDSRDISPQGEDQDLPSATHESTLDSSQRSLGRLGYPRARRSSENKNSLDLASQRSLSQSENENRNCSAWQNASGKVRVGQPPSICSTAPQQRISLTSEEHGYTPAPLSSTPVAKADTRSTRNVAYLSDSSTEELRSSDHTQTFMTGDASKRPTRSLEHASYGKTREHTGRSELKYLTGRNPVKGLQAERGEWTETRPTDAANTCGSEMLLKARQTKLQEEMRKCRERRNRNAGHRATSPRSLQELHGSSDCSSTAKDSRVKNLERVKGYLDNMQGPDLTRYAGVADDHSSWNRNTNSSCVDGTGQSRDDNWTLTAFSQPQQWADKRTDQPLPWTREEVEKDVRKELANNPLRQPLPLTRKGEAETGVNQCYDAPLTLLGEVAYQLERRIIYHVFKPRVPDASASSSSNDDSEKSCDKRYKFYGYTVINLPEKIRSHCHHPLTGAKDNSKKSRLLRRFQYIITLLRDKFDFQVFKHGRLCQELIKRHGIYGAPPDGATMARLGLSDFRSVRNHVIKLSSAHDRSELLVIVDCLHYLGQREQKPVLCF